MLPILEEYFTEHPIKRRIVEGLFNRGISVNEGRFHIDGIEISISEVAKTLGVNRRTVYDTIKIIESKPEIREVMSRIRPTPDFSKVAILEGRQIVSISVAPGFFASAFPSFLEVVQKYGCYISEILGKNMDKHSIMIRTIFHSTVPKKAFVDISGIDGVKKVSIETATDLGAELICDKCEVKVCPTKLSTSLFVGEMY